MRYLRLLSFALAAVLAIFCGVQPASAQTDSGTITGRVTDSSGAVLVGAQVTLTSIERGTVAHANTNDSGIYVLPSVSPGRYNLSVSHAGFRQVDLTNIAVNVQSDIEQNFKLSVGSVSESVTVNGGGNNINTTDGSVSTVIDRQFVENIPMNGRSFQTLILLSPGVVTNSPNGSDEGAYSVNGQRTDANGFYVDGASASNAPSNTSGAGSAAMAPSATALGTTQAMLQLDAMEEFRISTSTYSAEFGNHPGAQVSFRSRSGTNTWHGTTFDYLRNSAFDANNWFNTYSTTPIPTPAERQNDFGGTLGGPLSIPHVYSGRDRTFFFFSYEGLRLDTPSAAYIYDVPTNGTYITNNTYYSNPADAKWANLRMYAPPAMQPLLNSFPLPNCDTTISPQCVDYGQGSSPYISNGLTKGVIDVLSARIDYQATPSMRIFARYSDSNSNTTSYGSPEEPDTTVDTIRNRTYLLGVDNAIGGNFSNELRLQYAPALFHTVLAPYQAGGAQPYSFDKAQGVTQSHIGETYAFFFLPNEARQYTVDYGTLQFQPNITEALTWTHGKHLFKFGGMWLQTTSDFDRGNYDRSPTVGYSFTSASQVLSGVPSTEQVTVFDRENPTFKQWGLYAQDEWHVIPRLSLSMGLRWDFAPPPSITGGQAYTYTGNINNPSSLGLSKAGAPLYKTTWTDFAPRFGMAYVIHNGAGDETVFRAGGGIFYDSISLANLFGNGTELGAGSIYNYTMQYPLQASQILVPILQPTPPYTFVDYPATNLVPPYTFQWNAAVEQSLGSIQSVTIGYVASLGRKLNTYQQYSMSSLTNNEFSTFELYHNGPGSSYNSLQVKYQRQMAHGFQALASYTWAHALDWASSDNSVLFPLEKANSDNDVRHNLSAAAVYNLPSNYSNFFERAILAHWNADLLFTARTAFPYEPTGANVTDPATGDVYFGELNWNGQYPYLKKPGIPGGRQINPADFSITTTPLGVGTMPRNFLRAFGEAQANVSIARTFPIYERANLQFRAEAYNVTNHPNFGSVSLTCGTTTAGATCNNTIMGQATNTLNTALGYLNALYQQGGPRSLQFMLKLEF